jgi:hypothetical protein
MQNKSTLRALSNGPSKPQKKLKELQSRSTGVLPSNVFANKGNAQLAAETMMPNVKIHWAGLKMPTYRRDLLPAADL